MGTRGRNEGSIRRGAITLTSGTLIAQAVALISLPILSRLFPPEAFGYFSLVVAIASLVAPSVALKFESALMLTDARRDTASVLYLAFLCAGSLSVVAAVVVWIFEVSGLLTDNGGLPLFALWVGIFAFLTSAFTIAGQLALREKQFGSVARRTVYQSAVTSAVQLASATLTRSSVGLLTGAVLGRAAGILPLLYLNRDAFVRVEFRELARQVKRFWRFPTIFAPSALLNSAGLHIPLIFVGTWFSVADAGQFGMAERVLAIPLTLIGTSIGQAFEAEVGARLRAGRADLTRFFLRTSGVLVAVGVSIAVVVVLAAPVLVEFALGSEWLPSATLMQVMAPVLAIRLVASPTSRIFVLLEKARPNLLIDCVRVLLLGGALIVAITARLDLIGATVVLSMALGLTQALTWTYSLYLVRKFDRGADSPLGT